MVRYLLLGLGRSNKAVADDLMKNNITFDVYMEKGEIPTEISSYGSSVFNNDENLVLQKYEYVIKSPGIPFSHPIVIKCKDLNLKITNEIGYSIKYAKKPIIAITGTNGKTTSTSLVEHILNKTEDRASAVGNIGNSFLTEAIKQEKVLVTELSSFQLRDLDNFNPEVSIWLNIFPAHLDYHKTFDDYMESKQNIFVNQSSNHLFIFNEDDSTIKEAAKKKRGNKKCFSFENKNANAYFDGETIWIDGERWVNKSELGIRGVHNIQNTMASILSCLAYSSKQEIIEALKTFNGVEHRLEKVIENDTLKIYNDSKSTNTTAVKAALSAFDEPVVLMMGGLDRGNSFEDLIQEWSKVKTVVCFGQSGKKIYESANKFTEAIFESDIEKAIETAKEKVSDGGVLLFSPGCASWDQFSNFEERGKYFKDKVSNY